jgi:hypothetical protein
MMRHEQPTGVSRLRNDAATRAEVAPRFRVALVGCGRIADVHAAARPTLRQYRCVALSRSRSDGRIGMLPQVVA